LPEKYSSWPMLITATKADTGNKIDINGYK
jgi:hypothetical protein